MKVSPWFLSLIFAVLTLGYVQGAAPSISPQGIKQLYKDGEFDKVRTQLETFLKRSDATATRDERILAYKYLGVVYASRPDGAPQAEAYFFRLFDLSPKVTLTELYVSSTVNNLFEKTQERFLKEQRSANAVDELGHPKQGGNASSDEGGAMAALANQKKSDEASDKTKTPIRNTPRQSLNDERKGMAIWPWVLGAVVVGGGIGLYVMSSNESVGKKETLLDGTPKP